MFLTATECWATLETSSAAGARAFSSSPIQFLLSTKITEGIIRKSHIQYKSQWQESQKNQSSLMPPIFSLSIYMEMVTFFLLIVKILIAATKERVVVLLSKSGDI